MTGEWADEILPDWEALREQVDSIEEGGAWRLELGDWNPLSGGLGDGADLAKDVAEAALHLAAAAWRARAEAAAGRRFAHLLIVSRLDPRRGEIELGGDLDRRLAVLAQALWDVGLIVKVEPEWFSWGLVEWELCEDGHEFTVVYLSDVAAEAPVWLADNITPEKRPSKVAVTRIKKEPSGIVWKKRKKTKKPRGPRKGGQRGGEVGDAAVPEIAPGTELSLPGG